MIRNIIFDWSGTLVDDLPGVWQATNYVFRMAGIAEITLEKFRSEFTLPFKNFYDRYLPHVAPTQLEQWFHSHFKTLNETATELPHARRFLELCREREIRTFLLSSVHPDLYNAQARAFGFGQFIQHPYTAVWDKTARIHQLLSEHQLDVDQTLFIGDMQHDIETAHHGGVLSCAVLTGYNSLPQLRQSKPHLIVEHLGELALYLERHQWKLARQPNQTAAADLMPISTVGALIYNSAGQLLMIRTQKWSNLWGIPGGKIQFGETALAALHREVLEETNLRLQDVQFALVQDCIHSEEFYRDAHFVLLNYTARAENEQEVKLNNEAQEFRWVTASEAAELPLNTPTRVLLNHAYPAATNLPAPPLA